MWTYFWCVKKNNLVSSSDEGSGKEDEDCKSRPYMRKKKKKRETQCLNELCLSQCDEIRRAETNLPPNTSI